MVLFHRSLEQLRYGIELLQDHLLSTRSDLSRLSSNLAEILDCYYEMVQNKYKEEFSEPIIDILSDVKIMEILVEVETMTKSLVPTSTRALSEWITNIHNTSVVTMEQIGVSANQTLTLIEEANVSMSALMDLVNKALILVANKTTELQTKVSDIYMEKNVKHRVTDLLSYTFVMPIAMIGLSSFGLTMVVVRYKKRP
ncbi:unnamed protein product [Cylicostephanus goldi]|uniref:Uncharacterized protein n=1 Tax=Cylicostephanus goldi TaxID=71465 RepID=A0A3P6RH35_CYLGO|nr:unnamed protein product [Cylicostephanus goldi]